MWHFLLQRFSHYNARAHLPTCKCSTRTSSPPTLFLQGHHRYILGLELPNMFVIGLKKFKQAFFSPIPEWMIPEFFSPGYARLSESRQILQIFACSWLILSENRVFVWIPPITIQSILFIALCQLSNTVYGCCLKQNHIHPWARTQITKQEHSQYLNCI